MTEIEKDATGRFIDPICGITVGDSIFIGAHSRLLQLECYSIGCVALAIVSRADCSVEVVKEQFAD